MPPAPLRSPKLMIAGSKGGFVHTMTKGSYDYPRL